MKENLMPNIKTYRVVFTDYTQWEAYIQAPSAAKAISQCEDRWCQGTEGFRPEHKLDVVSEGCVTEDWSAEHVDESIRT